MTFLADENIDTQVVRTFRETGYDIEYITEFQPGIHDDIVMENANRDGRILITADKDWGELVFRQKQIYTGIILVRLSGFDPVDKEDILKSVLKDHSAELPTSFTVITKNNVRIRKK